MLWFNKPYVQLRVEMHVFLRNPRSYKAYAMVEQTLCYAMVQQTLCYAMLCYGSTNPMLRYAMVQQSTFLQTLCHGSTNPMFNCT